jgi:hypothetical protein
LGAMMGSRSGRFPEAWARRFCITVLVTVIRLTGCLGHIISRWDGWHGMAWHGMAIGRRTRYKGVGAIYQWRAGEERN